MIVCYLQNGFRSRRFDQHLAICNARFAPHRKETAPENLRVHIGQEAAVAIIATGEEFDGLLP